jgi:hypothetical protein
MADERSIDRWVVACYAAFAALLIGALVLAATGKRDAAVVVAVVAVIVTLLLRIRLQVLARRDLREQRGDL